MLDGTYKLSLNTPMGPLTGTITLITNGNNVIGSLETMGTKNILTGIKISNNQCKFSGNFNTPLGKLSYNAVCSINNDILDLDVHTSKGNFKISGKKI